MDLDHTIPYHPASRLEKRLASHPGNYGPLGRFSHRVKTHGGWRVQQPFPGVFVWRDPAGQIYLVDANGTRAVPRAGPRAGPNTAA